MIKVITGFMLAAFILTTLQPAVAQQPEKVPRIGYLSLAAKVSPKDEAFGGATDDISIHHQLKTAKQIGVRISQSVLFRADKLIK